MKKLHIAGIVFVGLGIVSYLTTSDEDKAERAGFSSVAAYETAIDAGFDTKAEYDASLEQQRLIAQAAERGFASVAAMQDAEARGFRTAANEAEAQQAGFDNRSDYNAHLNEQRLVAQAAERGFSSVEEMEEAAARGFNSAAEDEAAADAGYKTKVEYNEVLMPQLFTRCIQKYNSECNELRDASIKIYADLRKWHNTLLNRDFLVVKFDDLQAVVTSRTEYDGAYASVPLLFLEVDDSTWMKDVIRDIDRFSSFAEIEIKFSKNVSQTAFEENDDLLINSIKVIKIIDEGREYFVASSIDREVKESETLMAAIIGETVEINFDHKYFLGTFLTCKARNTESDWVLSIFHKFESAIVIVEPYFTVNDVDYNYNSNASAYNFEFPFFYLMKKVNPSHQKEDVQFNKLIFDKNTETLSLGSRYRNYSYTEGGGGLPYFSFIDDYDCVEMDAQSYTSLFNRYYEHVARNIEDNLHTNASPLLR